jgi:hypothetical protein
LIGASENTVGIVFTASGAGTGTGFVNPTVSKNTAVGYNSLKENIQGQNNTAVGSDSMLYNTTGNFNAAFGELALSSNTTGSGNTAISPRNSAGTYAPVFDPISENNRLWLGSTAITNAYVQVAWTVVSDARDKTDFAEVPHGLDFIVKLKPTAYRYKVSRDSDEAHGPVRYGFKAQDVLKLEGDNAVIVDTEDFEKLRFNDQSMIAVLVNSIKELNAKVEAQALEIANLKAK